MSCSTTFTGPVGDDGDVEAIETEKRVGMPLSAAAFAPEADRDAG